jgi:hypothetical protein
MTGKEFMNAVAHGREDILQLVLHLFHELKAKYCVIGGLAVNAYAEPVVSLDLDVVVVLEDVETICRAAEGRGLRVERFEHSINLTSQRSDLRIQLQTDPRYQEFIPRAAERAVLGYRMAVAALEDVLKGKLWAYQDETRRKSKRQKDLADILRLLETHPELEGQLPESVREVIH